MESFRTPKILYMENFKALKVPMNFSVFSFDQIGKVYGPESMRIGEI